MSPKPRLRLYHWKPEKASLLLGELQPDFHVDYDPKWQGSQMTLLSSKPVDAIVIDLSVRPSHGREIATAIRVRKSTRHLPIIFVEGDPVKTDAVRKLLPDAVFTNARKLPASVSKALAHPPAAPVVPVAMMDRGAARTNAQKLGIHEGQRVALYDPPPDYPKIFGDLPDGASLEENPDEILPLTLWFVREESDYLRLLPQRRRLASRGKLWIAFPKGGKAGITQFTVRDTARELGLIDYKIGSLDSYWTAMALAGRRA